jgi:hypothetical protein
MTQPSDPRLARLSAVANLIRDARLQRVTAARKAVDATQSLHDSLQPAALTIEDPALLSAQLAHQRWADHRRADLTRNLALHQAELRAAQADAAIAVARAQVLRRLLD